MHLVIHVMIKYIYRYWLHCELLSFVILQKHVDVDEHSQDDPKVMTFSEIMAAKRQRQKRLAEKRNADIARKKSKDTLELPHEDFGIVKFNNLIQIHVMQILWFPTKLSSPIQQP